ncbi:MAG: domain containing protein [Bacteroidota bacterium]|nr:domain containing protein [Bacteroidota bacterium]
MGKTCFFRLLVFFVLLLSGFSSKATHIVGGVLNYKYIGNDTFEFKLFVYRDCKNGIALFDNPALFTFSLNNNDYNDTLIELLVDSDTLDPHVDDPCVTVQPAVCVEFVTYTFRIGLPPNPNGYIVGYSRCCRNNSILNLTRGSSGDGLNQIDWGATYTINIPGTQNQHIQNSSPVFKNFPPVGICANKPIFFDHSADDADGDSLVYKLCTPYDGALKCNPNNMSFDPTCSEPGYRYQQPPYPNVIFEPPYSLTNLLGGVPLSIDPHTGLLTGTPSTIGQFVVGICVDEYRSGVFLTRTLRDFQFNVTDCGLLVVSSFFAPSVQCNNLTVGFTNHSTGATTYKWYFGDGDSSTAQNPNHTYADTGHYKVTLVCNQGAVCQNISSQIVSVQFKRVSADFSVSDTLCLSPGDTIKFTDLSTDAFNVVHWDWSFSTGKADTSKNSYVIYDGSFSTITATLTVSSINGCTSTLFRIFPLATKPTHTLPPSLSVCKGGTILIPLTMQGNNIFQWSPAAGLDNPNLQSPTATVNAAIKYYVTIKSIFGSDTCVTKDSIQLLLNDSLEVHIAPKDPFVICNGRSITLTASTIPTGGNFEWSSSPTFTPVLSTTNSVFVTVPGTSQTFYVRSTNANGCASTDSSKVTIADSIPKVLLGDTIRVCKDSVRLNAGTPPGATVTWSTSPTFIPVIGTGSSITIAQTLPIVKYYIKIQTGTCQNIDSVVVLFNDTVPQITLVDNLVLCNNIVNVTATVDHSESIIWSTSPLFTTVIATGNNLSLTQVPKTVTYYIKATYKGCASLDSVTVTILDIPQINISDSVFVCADSLRLIGRISNFDSVIWAYDSAFTTIFSHSPNIIVSQTVPEREYYIKVYYGQCSVTDSFRVFKNDTIPTVAIGRNQTIFCSDTVSASATADYFTALAWSTDRDFINIISTSLSFTTTQLEAEKWYYFKANYNFCFATDSIKLENRSIKYSKQDAEVCIGDKTTMDLHVQTPSTYNVTWHVNGDTIITNNSSTLEVTPDTTQMVRFSIVNLYDCNVTDSLRIAVHPIPVVDASVDKPVILPGEQVQLNVTQTPGFNYNWTPAGAVSNPSIYNPTSSPAQTTIYTVVVSDRSQCTGMDTVSVQVLNYECSLGSVFIPNAFTPNGDGINDIFKVRTNILRSIHLEVYDRWGIKVFQTDNIADGWDGTYKGQQATEDSYGYYFTGECLQGEQLKLKGNVSLLR